MWDAVFVVIFRGNTSKEGVLTISESFQSVVAKHPTGIGLLTIVEEKAPMPPSDARKALTDFLTRFGSSIKCSAVIHEGSGFRASAVRSIVAGLTLLARPPYPHRIYASVEASSEWMSSGLAAKIQRKFTAQELVLAVAEIRKHYVQK